MERCKAVRVTFACVLFMSVLASVLAAGCGGEVTVTTPSAMPTPSATPAPGWVSAPLEDYVHGGGLFAVAYPSGWQVVESEDGAEFVDPGGMAAYSVNVGEIDGSLSSDEMRSYVNTYLENAFAAPGSNYRLLELKGWAEGGFTASFSYVDAKLGEVYARALFEQEAGRLYVVTMLAAGPEAEVALARLSEIAVTLAPMENPPTRPLVTRTPTPVVPEGWAAYVHPTQRFSFLYPASWECTEDKSGVECVTGERAFFRAHAEKAAKDEEEIVGDYVDALEKREGVSRLWRSDVSTFYLGIYPGKTVDFTYRDSEERLVAGSIVAAGVGDRVYVVSFDFPAELAESALETYSFMMQTFAAEPGGAE